MEKIAEHKARKISGFIALFLWIAGLALEAWLVYTAVYWRDPMYLWGIIPWFLVLAGSLNGFFIVHPNEAKALVLFGKYTGTVRQNGFWYANPFVIKKAISLKIHNFNSDKIKVNDKDGNPIEIAAVVVWRVIDTAHALFDVEDYQQFVDIQSETAIRALASQYAYDAQDDTTESLRGSPQVIADALQEQVQTRLEVAGVEIIESRISHLAYAQEIAQAMLRRQQAQAIVAARKKIVEGAVGMVEDALQMLKDQKIVNLDEEKKATMVNNLMVALVADADAQPVINTGTLYQ